MSPQTFNGVRVVPSIIDQLDKLMIGYAIQRITDSGNNHLATQ